MITEEVKGRGYKCSPLTSNLPSSFYDFSGSVINLFGPKIEVISRSDRRSTYPQTGHVNMFLGMSLPGNRIKLRDDNDGTLRMIQNLINNKSIIYCLIKVKHGPGRLVRRPGRIPLP